MYLTGKLYLKVVPAFTETQHGCDNSIFAQSTSFVALVKLKHAFVK